MKRVQIAAEHCMGQTWLPVGCVNEHTAVSTSQFFQQLSQETAAGTPLQKVDMRKLKTPMLCYTPQN